VSGTKRLVGGGERGGWGKCGVFAGMGIDAEKMR